ncbi:DUF7619 domain-containing protein [Neolewinella aurantiaca]|nr:SdrD B-like domain-containing protein [Neolewinella aurantiaca]
MRILLALFVCFFASWLPGQCIDVRVDSVFCLGNGEYGILFDVEGTGNEGWVIDSAFISGSYFTDEIFQLDGLEGHETSLVFRDAVDANCTFEVLVQRPDGCNTTDPCFGFEMTLESTPGSCGSGIRVGVSPSDIGIVDSLVVLGWTGVVVWEGVIPISPGYVEFDNLPPGDYIASITINGSCSLAEEFTIVQSADCGSISGFTWLDEIENGLRDPDEIALEGVEVNLVSASDFNEVIATQVTTANGYFFTNVVPGDYVLLFDPQAGNTPTTYQVGSDPAVDNDVSPDYATETITVGADDAVVNIDGGFLPAPCSVVVNTIDVICSGGFDGFISADPTGTAPFTFLWSTGSTTATLQGVPAGTYFVTVVDATGCESVGTAVIEEASDLTVAVSEVGSSCDDSNDHFLTASVQGGVAPYTYEWTVEGDFFPVCTSVNCDDPSPGEDYVLTVTDANGCTVNVWWRVSGVRTTIDFFSPFYLGCDGNAVTISVGDSTDYEYTWVSPSGISLTGYTIEATETGTYTVTGTSPDHDCALSGEAIVLPAPSLPQITLQRIDSTECGFGQCVYPLVSGSPNQNISASFTWYGPDGNVYQTDGGWLCTEETGLFILVVEGLCDTATLSIDLNTSMECADLNGTVYIDDAGNCSFDAGDLPAAGILVHIASTDGTRNYYAISDANGQYGQEVETGEYTVTPVVDPTRPFGQCDPAATVTVVAGQPNQADVFLPVLISCPLLTVDVSMPFLRRCFLSCAYIEYENEGSAIAEDAQLVVTLDPMFVGVDPSIVPSMVNGNTYTFDLGDLPPFASGRIYFNFTVSCDAELGQAHCLEAEITPNDICTPPEDWNGALVSVDPGSCDGDEVTFRIANIGDNPMSVPLSYVVVEDGIMMTPQPQIEEELGPDEVFTISLPANGQTYQVITNQEPNAPASVTPTAMIEGCSTSPVNGGTTGFANILSLGNGFPSEAVVCLENVGAYDPNDKNGYPLGFGAENNIAEGTELRYAIRFQNTGTDTAFNVVIRDTISHALDLSTFKAGASSHDYTVSIDSQRVVTFTFANIMLPDSNVNLLASQGVVNFTIDHSPELEPGDYIFNNAAIYFDFNEPVITNTSSHRIDIEGLPVGVRALRAQEVSLRVYPNPSNGVLQLEIPNNDVQFSDVLSVTDLYGSQLAQTTYGQIGSGWDVRSLPAGYYLVVVHDEAGRPKGRAGFVIAQ